MRNATGAPQEQIALTTRPRVMPAPHVLAVAVFEIQIKLVLREELKKLFSVWSIITMSKIVVLLEFGGEILVVHAITQNVDFKPSSKELSNLKALE